MNWYDSKAKDFDAIEALAERCAELDIFLWRVGVGENRWAKLVDGHPLGHVFDTPQLSSAVLRAVDAWSGNYVEISPGVLVTVLESHDAQQIMTAAMVLSSKFDESSPLVRDAVAKNGSESTRSTDFENTQRYDGNADSAVIQSIEWMLADLRRIEENHGVILRFSRELMDAYEQIGLLYRLGRAMGSGTSPEHFVSELCHELEQYTRFGWVAAVFGEDTGRSSEFAGHLEDVEHTSKRRETLQGALPALFQSVERSGSVILDPTKDSLASAIASELAVQSIGLEGKPLGTLVAGDKGGDSPGISSVDTQLLKAAAEFMSVFLDNARMYEDQRRLFLGTLQALTSSIDAKDRYTCGHSERVAQLAVMLSEALHYDDDFVEDVRIGGLVHDVGKIGVPEAVLQKPDRLTREEFGLIQQHPEIGCRILRDVPQFSSVLPGVLHHHERWDGNGYPHGLSQSEIPLIARILGVADTFDAMSSTRSYRQAMTRDVVIAEMVRCAGTQLDPALVSVFVMLDFARYDETVRRHAEQYHQAA